MEISATVLKTRFFEFLRRLKEPIIVTAHHKKVAILTPYSEEEATYQEAVAGNITWEDYRKRLIETGYKQLSENPEKISPSHVIASEGIENEKIRTRLQEIGIRLMAAKFFAGLLKPAKCSKCGIEVLPEGGIEVDNKYLRAESGGVQENKL